MEDSRSSSSGDDNDSSDSSSIEEENNGNALSPGKESTSSDSSSSDSSSSDSNSSDSSSEQSENEEQSVKVSNVSEVSNESSSESLSSSSLSEDEEENGKMEIRSDNELVSSSSEESDREQGKSSNVKNNNKTDSNNNSDNESEESDSESEYESKPRNTQNNINNIEEHNGENGDKLFHSNGKITSTEIDKSESSSEKNSSYKMNVPLTNGNKLKHKLDSNNDTLDVKDYARPSKKLNSNVSVYFKPLSVYKNQRKNGNSNKAENKSNGNGNIYNRRINPEKVAFLDERLKDNSFLAKDGAIDSYGYKAHNDLFATRGKDFRAQKTKKKRGSYRGGKIDFESHSIKFAADD